MDAHPRTPRRPSLRRRTPLVVSLALTASIAGAAFGAPAAPVSAAASSPPGRFVAVEPCRLLDSRPQTLRAGGTVDVDVVGERCGVPADAIAAAFTLTAVAPAAPGFVTMWPTGQQRPDTSVLNYRADQVVPNAQIVQLGARGQVRLYTSAAADLVVDVTGYFEAVDGPVSSGRFVPVEQHRLVDTRATGRPSRGGVVEVDADVPAGAIAAAVNITTTQSSGPGYFTAYAEGAGRPTASVLNTDGAGQTRAAAAIVPLERGRFDVYTSLGDHVVVDIVGYFTGDGAEPREAGLFVASTPIRLVDTRLAVGPAGGPRLWDGGEREFAVEQVTGGPVAAIAANVTMVDTEDAGFVSAGPARVARAAVSSVNAATAQATVANAAVIPTSTRGISLATLEATHLVVDVTGWFTGTPVDPDTGAGAPVNAPPRDRRVVIISDSAMAGVRWNGALGGFQGFRAEARLESCRRLVQSSCRGREGYAPLTARNEVLSLPQAGDEDLLVIATGYNDWNTRFSSDFDEVLGAARARGFHHVAWVTYRSQVGYSIPSSGGLQSNYAEMNRILRAKVASGSFPEVRLWDLDRYTSPAPAGWFHSDGVHETVVGSWGVADWISRHVRAFDDRPCVHPWEPGGRVDDPCPDPDPLRATRGVIDIAALYGL